MSIIQLKKTVSLIKENEDTTLKPFHLVVSAGICDFTSKITHSSGTEIHYPISKLDAVISTLEEITALSVQELQCHIKFAAIPPASLMNYRAHQIRMGRLASSIFSDEELQKQQKQLEDDINQVNNYIYQLNDRHNVRTIKLEKNMIKSSIKKRGRKNLNRKIITKFVYHDLYDGVHANHDLQQQCFFFLTMSVYHDIISNSSPSDLLSFEDNTECSETWDFKRV